MDHFFKRLLVFLGLLLLFVGAATCLLFERNLKQQIDQQSLRQLNDVKLDFDKAFSVNEKYELIDIDTAYLARVRTGLIKGSGETPAEVQSLIHAEYFLKKAKASDGSVQSIYVALFDPEAKYVLTDTGLVSQKYLKDKSWLDAYQDCVDGDLCQFRKVSVTAANGPSFASVLSVYHYVRSTHWNTGEQISGCIVINYYLTPLLTQLARTLPSSNSIYLQDTKTGQYYTYDAAQLLPESELAAILQQNVQSGETTDRKYVFFHEASDVLPIEYTLICDKAELYRSITLLNIALLLMAILMLSCFLLFFIIFQMENKKYINNLSHILEISGEAQNTAVPEAFPLSSRSGLTRYIMQHAVSQKEIRDLLQREKDARAEMEMLALQSQINPHFLLNTVDFLYWSQVGDYGHDNRQVAMMENLCKILKYSLDSSSVVVSIAEEIEQAKCYLCIQEKRKNQHFRVYYDVPEGVLGAPVMKLILQPVLENCFQHGMPGVSNDDFSITLRVRQTSSKVCIQVIDTGAGLPQPAIDQLNDALQRGTLVSQHIGIRNINRRLQLFYGCGTPVSLSATPGHGLTVTINIPLCAGDSLASGAVPPLLNGGQKA